jgi:glutathione S-transferase
MLTVYAIPVSLYCAKLRILLRHKQLAWREIPPPGGYGSAEYRQIVASGNLPALVDGDLLLADSEAIAEYLNEQHPEPPMLPADAVRRAKARERSRFHDTRLEPAVRVLFAYLDDLPEDRTLFERQSRTISARLAQFAQMLDDGSHDEPTLTLGDCGFPITFEWIGALTPILGLEVDWPAPVTGYRERLARHPAVAAELASYGPALAGWLASRGTGA